MLCKEIIILTGPTASGKTDLALSLADRLPNVEILSVDSRQIYRHMDIGTAKPTTQELARCPHHFIDIIDPDKAYSAGQFCKAARSLIGAMWERGALPILVGGTGLYWQSLLDGFFADETDYNLVRGQLQERLAKEGLAPLYEELGRLDPITQRRLSAGDTQRILRGLEVALCGEEPLSELKGNAPAAETAFHCNAQLYCLTLGREKLHRRIDQRVDAMLDEGLVAEVRDLVERGYGREAVAMGTLGYVEILDYLEGKQSLAEAAEWIKTRTRQFAKRQMTWYRRDRRLRMLNLDLYGYQGAFDRIVQACDYATGRLADLD